MIKKTKPVKIIHLAGFNRNKNSHHVDKESDYYFVSSWAGLIARRIKKYKPGLDIETWRTEGDFKKRTFRRVFDIIGVIWPYKIALVKNLFTLEMARQLSILCKTYDIVLHYHDLFNLRFILFMRLYFPGVKLILSHHGGTPPVRNSMKDILLRMLYQKRIAAITYLTPCTRDYILSIRNHPPIVFLPVGAEFDTRKPSDTVKARKLLSLDPDMVYGLYVGKFYTLKSVDLILEVYKALKNKYKFSIIFVGGNRDAENDLFEEVANSGCPYFGVQYGWDMPKFFNAADFYIHPAFNPQFGGLDVSWMEALACNKPVLSTQLDYLDFDYHDLGISLQNKNEIIPKTEWMIKHYKLYHKCREVARKHLDGNGAIMEKLAGIYESIHS